MLAAPHRTVARKATLKTRTTQVVAVTDTRPITTATSTAVAMRMKKKRTPATKTVAAARTAPCFLSL